MRLIGILAAAVVVLASSARAAACQCGPPPPVVKPTDGAVGVPRNVEVLARTDLWLEAEIVLHEAGSAIPIAVSIRTVDAVGERLHFVRPSQVLRSDVAYEVEVRSSYEVVVSTFVTGDEVDVEPPAPAGATSLVLENRTEPATCVSSCSHPGTAIHVVYEPPETELALLELRSDDASEPVTTVLLTPWDHDGVRSWPTSLDPDTCFPTPWLDPERIYCASVVAVDDAGNRSAGDDVACAVPLACTLRESDCAGCDESPSVDVPLAVPAASPSGCAVAAAGAPASIGLLGPLALLLRRRRRP